jgi:hypothetical protein
MKEPQLGLATLPDDCIVAILSNVAAVDLARVGCSSRHLLHVSSNQSLWQHLAQTRWQHGWPYFLSAMQSSGRDVDWRHVYKQRVEVGA